MGDYSTYIPLLILNLGAKWIADHLWFDKFSSSYLSFSLYICCCFHQVMTVPCSSLQQVSIKKTKQSVRWKLSTIAKPMSINFSYTNQLQDKLIQTNCEQALKIDILISNTLLFPWWWSIFSHHRRLLLSFNGQSFVASHAVSAFLCM